MVSWVSCEVPPQPNRLRSSYCENGYPLVNKQKAIENGHLYLVYPLKIVIFHSYVSLPEGTSQCFMESLSWNLFFVHGFFMGCPSLLCICNISTSSLSPAVAPRETANRTTRTMGWPTHSVCIRKLGFFGPSWPWGPSNSPLSISVDFDLLSSLFEKLCT